MTVALIAWGLFALGLIGTGLAVTTSSLILDVFCAFSFGIVFAVAVTGFSIPVRMPEAVALHPVSFISSFWGKVLA